MARRPIVGCPAAADPPGSFLVPTPQGPAVMLTRLAHVAVRRRWIVIGAWLALTLFGAFSAKQVSSRWLESFSIPGFSGYEASQRTLDRFGTGMRPPVVVVFHTEGDATTSS